MLAISGTRNTFYLFTFPLCSHLPSSQVIKKKLAVCIPMLTCGEFFYEEGEGLEDDEVRNSLSEVRNSLCRTDDD